jgi:hypothetical protein
MGLLDSILPGVVNTVLAVFNVSCILTRTTREFQSRENSAITATSAWSVGCTPPSDFNQFIITADSTKKNEAKFILDNKGIGSTGASVTITVDAKTDTLTFAGHTFRITKATPIYSGTSVAAWSVEVQR